MPWLKCESCRRVLLVPQGPLPRYFHCTLCRERNPGTVFWDETLEIHGSLYIPDYHEFREQMLQGLGRVTKEGTTLPSTG
jgi:hypothetical protein